MADRPETSRYTGAFERIQARKAVRAAARLRRLGKSEAARAVLHKAGIDARLSDADKASSGEGE